jgi:hypothetical protein
LCVELLAELSILGTHHRQFIGQSGIRTGFTRVRIGKIRDRFLIYNDNNIRVVNDRIGNVRIVACAVRHFTGRLR